jgi:hypothetical protein
MVIATTGDLMERMEAEEALEKSLATSEQALRELPDPKFALDQHAVVGVTDVHGTITYVNEKFWAISLYSEDRPEPPPGIFPADVSLHPSGSVPSASGKTTGEISQCTPLAYALLIYGLGLSGNRSRPAGSDPVESRGLDGH